MKGQHIYCSNSRVSWSSWTGGCEKIDLADLSGFVFDRKRASHRATRLRSVATSSLSQRIHYRANRMSSLGPVTFSIFSCFLHIQSAVLQAPRQIRHPERSASQIYRKQRALLRGVEGPRRCLLADALGSLPAANYTEISRQTGLVLWENRAC
jgi:hypothetical protein